MRHTAGPWAWYELGGKLVLVANYGGRKVILCDRKGKLSTCDPERTENYLIDATGAEPDLQLIESAPVLASENAALREINADLLAALEAAFDALNAFCWTPSSKGGTAIELARAAFVKARGEFK